MQNPASRASRRERHTNKNIRRAGRASPLFPNRSSAKPDRRSLRGEGLVRHRPHGLSLRRRRTRPPDVRPTNAFAAKHSSDSRSAVTPYVANALRARPPAVGPKRSSAGLSTPTRLCLLGKMLVVNEGSLWAALLHPTDSGSVPRSIRRRRGCRFFVIADATPALPRTSASTRLLAESQ